MKKIILLYVVLVLAGCGSASLLKPKASSSLNSKNLEKNPVTGVYILKTSNSSDKISSGIPAPAKTAVRSEVILEKGGAILNKPAVYSKDLDVKKTQEESSVLFVVPNSSEKKTETAVKPKTDWAKLIIYYALVAHLFIAAYILHKKGLLQKIKNPFKKEVLTKSVNPKIKKVKKVR